MKRFVSVMCALALVPLATPLAFAEDDSLPPSPDAAAAAPADGAAQTDGEAAQEDPDAAADADPEEAPDPAASPASGGDAAPEPELAPALPAEGAEGQSATEPAPAAAAQVATPAAAAAPAEDAIPELHVARGTVIGPAKTEAQLTLLADSFEQKVKAFLADDRWAPGAWWGSGATPELSDYGAWGCAAYAADFAAYVYGNSSMRGGTLFEDASQIRAGDIVHFDSSRTEHWFVVLDRQGGRLHTIEGAYSSSVRESWDAYWIEGNTLHADWAPGAWIEDAYHNLPSTGYTDVRAGIWYATAVADMRERGWMKGSGGQFGAGQALKRADLALILFRIANPGAPEGGASNATGMADVADGAYYTAAANWAVEHHVIEGYAQSDGTRLFGPNNSVTFEEAAKILATFCTAEGGDLSALEAFADYEDVHEWAAPHLSWGVSVGLVSGYGDKTLRPRESLSRERAAVLLSKAAGLGLL